MCINSKIPLSYTKLEFYQYADIVNYIKQETEFTSCELEANASDSQQIIDDMI